MPVRCFHSAFDGRFLVSAREAMPFPLALKRVFDLTQY